MVSFFGLGGQPKLRPFKVTDMMRVMEIIEQHDEDDAEEAYQSLSEDHEGMFVLSKGGKIVGVTGAVADPHVEGVCWLSWTYVDHEYQSQGLGRLMFDQLRGMLENSGVRRLFISTSDYMEDGVDLYAKAKAYYKAMGADLELKINDYHDKGETRFIYGIDVPVLDFESPPAPAGVNDDVGGELVFTDVEVSPESKGGFSLSWEEKLVDEPVSHVALASLKEKAIQQGARFLVAAPPSVFERSVEQELKENGFVKIGKLKDYYEKNIDQNYWICTF